MAGTEGGNFLLTEVDQPPERSQDQLNPKNESQQESQSSNNQTINITNLLVDQQNTFILPKIRSNSEAQINFSGVNNKILNPTNQSSSMNNSIILTRGNHKTSLKSTSKFDILKTMMAQNFSQDRKVGKLKSHQMRSTSMLQPIAVNKYVEENAQNAGQYGQRGNIMNILETYRRNIEQDYNRLYQDKVKLDSAEGDLKTLQKKKYITNEINQKEEVLMKEIKFFNRIQYEINQKENQLREYQLKIQKFELNPDVNQLALQIEQMESQIVDLEEKLEEEYDRTDTLSHMLGQRKNIVQDIRQFNANYQIIIDKNKQQINISKINQSVQSKILEKIHHQFNKVREKKNSAVQLPEKFQNHLQDEISEFGDQTALETILKNQRQILDEKEVAVEQARIRKAKMERDEEDQQILAQKKEVKLLQQLVENQKQKFEPLANMTKLTKEADLVNHYEFLDFEKQNLTNEREKLESEIEQFQESIRQKEKWLKFLQLEDTERSKTKNANGAASQISPEKQTTGKEDIQVENITDLEQVCFSKEEEIHKIESQIKKQNQLIDNVLLSITRIMYQLQPQQSKNRNFEVSRNSITDSLSIVGNNLENMLSLIANNRGTHAQGSRSINTDTTFLKPPPFIGINPHTSITIHPPPSSHNQLNYSRDNSISNNQTTQSDIQSFQHYNNFNSHQYQNDQHEDIEVESDDEQDHLYQTRNRIQTDN